MKLLDRFRHNTGFSIVELLIVVVVIGILATIMFISYVGITDRVGIASIDSDLSSNARKLQLYFTQYGSYPTTIDGSYCPTAPTANTNYCLKLSSGNSITYFNGNINSFLLIITRGPISRRITESTSPVATSIPSAPTINSVSPNDYGQLSTTFTAGSDGGTAITNYEYSTNGGTNWTARSPANTASPLVITGLTGNTSYSVRIRAINASGPSTQSNQIAMTTIPYEAPVCTWGGFSNPISTYTITNVLSTSIGSYTFSPTTGTVSFNQSNGVFTVNTSNEFEVTVTPRSLSLTNGPSRIVGRKNITYYTVTSSGGCISGGTPPENVTCQDWCGGGGTWDGPMCCCAYQQITNTYENSPPPNYQKIGSVWVRL